MSEYLTCTAATGASECRRVNLKSSASRGAGHHLVLVIDDAVKLIDLLTGQ